MRISSVRSVAAATAAAALLVPASAFASHNITAPISVDPLGAIGNDESSYSDMTPDGRFVAFVSAASNLVAGDTNGVGDVFVHDRRTGVTERVSLGLKGEEADGDSNFLGIATDPAISDDGRYVAFKSEATNLVRGDRNDLTDVFVHDRQDDVTELVSVDNAGDESSGDDPGISPDGRYVAFTTSGIDGNFVDDVYLRDRVAGTTTLPGRVVGKVRATQNPTSPGSATTSPSSGCAAASAAARAGGDPTWPYIGDTTAASSV